MICGQRRRSPWRVCGIPCGCRTCRGYGATPETRSSAPFLLGAAAATETIGEDAACGLAISDSVRESAASSFFFLLTLALLIRPENSSQQELRAMGAGK